MLVISIDSNQMQQIEQRLGALAHKAPNAVNSALNRATTNVSSNLTKEVRKLYTVKAADIKETLKITKSTKATLRAMVQSKGTPIKLDRFKVSPKTVNPKRKNQLKVTVKKGSTKQVTGAFVANLSGIKIMKRVTDKRLPIERLYGPSVPQMADGPTEVQKILQGGVTMFNNRLEHEITRILS